MTELTVREADTDDVVGIQRVARAGWHAAYDDLLGPGTVDDCIDDWYADERLVEGIADEATDFLVALADERVVGYASVGPTGDDHPDSVAGLYSIYVHPDRWNQGIGTELLDRCRDRLRERGFERLVFRVFERNDVGIAFYRARGFERIGTEGTEIRGQSVVELTFGGDL